MVHFCTASSYLCRSIGVNFLWACCIWLNTFNHFIHNLYMLCLILNVSFFGQYLVIRKGMSLPYASFSSLHFLWVYWFEYLYNGVVCHTTCDLVQLHLQSGTFLWFFPSSVVQYVFLCKGSKHHFQARYSNLCQNSKLQRHCSKQL